jgi:hypothetical protein
VGELIMVCNAGRIFVEPPIVPLLTIMNDLPDDDLSDLNM